MEMKLVMPMTRMLAMTMALRTTAMDAA